MQIGFNMDDSGLDKIRSNTSCRQPASGELAYSASLRQVHSSALHQAPTNPIASAADDVTHACLLSIERSGPHLLVKTNLYAFDDHICPTNPIFR